MDEIRDRVRDGTLDPRAASSRLWQFLEEEARLSEECGLSRQAILLQDGRQLAKVAHLGMVALYFATEDGQVGTAVPGLDGYSFQALDGEGARAVQDLFDSFDKQVRSGKFRLPLPAPPTASDTTGEKR